MFSRPFKLGEFCLRAERAEQEPATVVPAALLGRHGEATGISADWFQLWAPAMLGVAVGSRVPHLGPQPGVTPVVFHANVTRSLLRHLATAFQDRPVEYATDEDIVNAAVQQLRGRLPWTEYGLYYTFMHGAGLQDNVAYCHGVPWQ